MSLFRAGCSDICSSDLALNSVQAQSTLSYFGNYFLVQLIPLTEVCGTSAAHFPCPIEANHTYTIDGKLLVSVDPGAATKLPNIVSIFLSHRFYLLYKHISVLFISGT